MITEKNNVFYCDCGFFFERGRSGAHNCETGLRKKLAESEAKLSALAAENAGLKKSEPAPFSKLMMEALDVYQAGADEVPELAMLSAYKKLRDGLKTPATDAFLAEVRAQGVEMLREHPAIKLCSLTHVCDEFAAQIRKGVRS
ncbi:hypothetical protein [Enterobacter hormaechei]|uniref:hypothetical protein n=1 Tax=Enterobacter hormaechei TaxID=158836 RepID=UPI001D00ACB8|nr:hypothetical protein [Enterobacter hormaechei]